MKIQHIKITKKKHTEIYTIQEYKWHFYLVVAKAKFFKMGLKWMCILLFHKKWWMEMWIYMDFMKLFKMLT